MSSNYAFEGPVRKRRSTRSKLIVIGSIVALLGVIAVGVGVGVGVTQSNKSSSSSSKSNSGSNSNSGSKSGGSNGGDPSKFDLDPNLKKSFYGIAYTPEGALMPNCGAQLEDVIRDVQLMSQLTTRIRLYGSDCNQTALVLEAIRQTKVDLKVFVGNYVTPGDDEVYTRQRDNIMAAIQEYGTDHIAGVTVGNEFILNYLNANSGTSPNDAVGNQGAQLLIANIKDTRSHLEALNLDKTIPVGNSDAGSYFNDQVLQSVDYAMSNVHAWFANTTAENGPAWTFQFFEEQNVQPAKKFANNPTFYIAEAGWPTKSSDAANARNGASGSDASTQSLQVFMDNFVCQANSNNIPYFFFEFKDEKWKDDLYGGVEGWWGLFNGDRTLKDITLPDCASP